MATNGTTMVTNGTTKVTKGAPKVPKMRHGLNKNMSIWGLFWSMLETVLLFWGVVFEGVFQTPLWVAFWATLVAQRSQN